MVIKVWKTQSLKGLLSTELTSVFISVMCTVRLQWDDTRNFSFDKYIQSSYLVPGTGDKEMNKSDKVPSLKESGKETWQQTNHESTFPKLIGSQNNVVKNHPFILVFLGT